MTNEDYFGYVNSEYLQTIALDFKPLKERSYELMHLKTGYKIIDLGCGPGTDTIPLSKFVGITGKVIGIDIDNEMITNANKNAVEAGVVDMVIHKHYDAMSLPCDSDHFDACRAERLFQHLSNPEKVLSEMVRITKPGGWIVVADSDHSSLSIDNSVIDIEWKLRRFRTDRYKDGYAGRQLYRLFKRQNISDITVELFPFFFTNYKMTRYLALLDEGERDAVTAGIITKEELQYWHESLEEADKDDTFFASFMMTIIAGRKSSLNKNPDGL